MIPKLSKIVSFLQFFAGVNKRSKAVQIIYIYASESFCFTLLENSIVIIRHESDLRICGFLLFVFSVLRNLIFYIQKQIKGTSQNGLSADTKPV